LADRATEVALFRYSLIRQAADPALSKAQRGRLVRALAAEVHAGPGGDPVRVARGTIDRWIRAWRAGGFEALKPPARQVEPRTSGSVLGLAEDLRRENPARTAAHIRQLISVAQGWAPSERTLQRHLARVGLPRRTGSAAQAVVFGRFEATRPNELWVGDALHGPRVEAKAAILFGFLDDHSRVLTGYRWVHAEDTLRAEAALRWGIASRGVPDAVYLDNGSPFVSVQLARALAVLGVRLIHSRPGRPQGRGKIERFFRTVRDQFLIEVGHDEVASLQELNEAFSAWVETVYHRRLHSETGQAPIERFGAGGPPRIPTPAELHEAFLWSETRMVTKTATVSLHSNLYEVDAALVGRRVELVFDPFDLTDIEVRFAQRPMGKAVPVRIGRHAHPQARVDGPPPPLPTGIEYLRLIQARQEADWDARISYSGLGPERAKDNETDHDDNEEENR
jgi:putative transposase